MLITARGRKRERVRERVGVREREREGLLEDERKQVRGWQVAKLVIQFGVQLVKKHTRRQLELEG